MTRRRLLATTSLRSALEARPYHWAAAGWRHRAPPRFDLVPSGSFNLGPASTKWKVKVGRVHRFGRITAFYEPGFFPCPLWQHLADVMGGPPWAYGRTHYEGDRLIPDIVVPAGMAAPLPPVEAEGSITVSFRVNQPAAEPAPGPFEWNRPSWLN